MPDSDHAGGQSRPLVGARFRHEETGGESESAAAVESPARFDMSRRGYDRHQVDVRIDAMEAELQQLRERLSTAERERDAVHRRLNAMDAEQWQRRTRTENLSQDDVNRRGPAETARGSIAEKVVRLAQREALMVRATAQQEATRILDAARSQAERDREEAEDLVRAWLQDMHDHITEGRADPAAREADTLGPTFSLPPAQSGRSLEPDPGDSPRTRRS